MKNKCRALKICLCLLLSLLTVFAQSACGRGDKEAAATDVPTEAAVTAEATDNATEGATEEATGEATLEPAEEATEEATEETTDEPTGVPTDEPTKEPTGVPTSAPTSAPTNAPTAAPTQANLQQIINAKIASMSLEEKVGQLLMFGFAGRGTLDPAFLQVCSEFPVGNMIFYGMNINKNDGEGGFKSVRDQINILESQYAVSVPRFFSVDVEGGDVVRFDWDPPVKSAYELGQGTATAAYEQFKRVGQKLRSVGINIDLAPVLDIAPEPLSTFLGTRIISGDPDKASEIGNAIVRGLHAGGCMATGKHFPGHGCTVEDSHDHTPTISKPADEMWSYDLIPFSSAISNGIDCIMPAHIMYPAFDSNEIATTSRTILTDMLRGRLGFGGIIISDEITMGGLTNQYGSGEAAVKFILAGGDIVLCGADYPVQRQVISSLYTACTNGTISQQRLNQSVYRILAYKYSYGIWTP